MKYILSGLSLLLLSTSIAQAQTTVNYQPIKPNQSSFEETDLTSLLPQTLQLNTSTENSETQANQITGVAQLRIHPPTEIENIAPPETIESNPQINLESNFLDSLDDSMEQVTNVNQLRDVSPTDWAYEALRNLVETYGCIAGYPDGTFRGNRAITRYEFAAGLNACLQQIERLIAASTADFITKDDLAVIQRLTEEFEVELATIKTRIDNLEGRTAFLEDHQFSTTTILNGEVIFGLASAFGGDPPGGCQVLPDDTGFFFEQVNPGGMDLNDDPEVDCLNRGDPDTNTVLTNLVRLGLQSSFTGKDRLRIFLTTGNFDFSSGVDFDGGGGFVNAQSLNTYMAGLSYQADLNNKVILNQLEYRFPVFDDRLVVSIIPEGFSLSSVLTANSPYFDIGRGAISRFGQLSPLFRIGGVLNAGAGIDLLMTERLRLQAAYGTADSGDPDNGIFGADRSVLGVQFLAEPFDNLLTGVTYVNAYSSDGTLGTFTGSVNAETLGLWSGASVPPPSDTANTGFDPCCGQFIGDLPAQINAVGGTLQWRFADDLTLGAWGGYIFANFLDRLPDFEELGTSAGKKPFANAATFTVSLGWSDPFGREGDLLAFIFGMPPKLVDAGPTTPGTPVPFFEQTVRGGEETVVTDNNRNLDTVGETDPGGLQDPDNALPRNVGEEDEATSLHFEVFYRFRVTDNISITPGFFLVTNPGHIEDNDTIFVGTLRTTFRF